ncbi:MAG: MBL fold metallo-hydrolase [Agathobacter sp.]|nr:MBL fold metallo-hydrolase [Agathobacter sp.]
MQVKFYDTVDDSLIKFSVIISKSNGKWVFCKHKERDTYECPGGRRESGESVLECAKRELYEETGAIDYEITPVCVYSVIGKTRVNETGDESFGMLYFVEIRAFEQELNSEIECIEFFEDLPEQWTYPLIQPLLIEEYERRSAKWDDWFTVEQIDKDTYVVSEYRHREETHCYLLLGKEKALLIDTGLGVANIKEVVDKITSLPIMVVTTHGHWDHIGGHRFFEEFAVHEEEKEWIMDKFPLPLSVVKQNLLNGNCDFPKAFDIEDYNIFSGIPQQILQDGDEIDLGNRKVKVLHTPGHSPGHCCFYEAERDYLYSGDLIYKGCLDMFYPTTNPKLYAQSIERVSKLEVKRILPGHHSLDVPVEIISNIKNAFSSLKKDGDLEQGKGIFEFGEFQIHL